MSTMDGDQSSRFVSSLVKSIQALCNGYIDFSSSIEVIGHIHLNIDRSVKLDYVLTEEVSKSVSEGATVFASHSYHSQPPSSAVSKNASDSSSSNRNRSKQSQGDDGESAGFRSSTTDVHTPSKSDSHAQKRSSGHYGENSESSHSGSFVNTGDMLSLKQESPQKLCRTPESLDRRRKSAHGPQSQFHHHSPSPAVKRSRHSDSIPEREPQDFEVIEIKEEPDEAPAVFFGNSSSHMAAGQDLQTPDFSSVVMESLDRVSQVEGTDLVGEGGSMQQPFPVMMHSNPGMSSSSSSLAGPSQSDPQSQSLASTSGSGEVDSTKPSVHGDRSQKPNTSFAATTQTTISAGQAQQPVQPKHFLQRIPQKMGGKDMKLLQSGQTALLLLPCKACREEGFGKVSSYFCPVCPGQPAFCCTKDCFVSYHKRNGYSIMSVYGVDHRRQAPHSQAGGYQLRSVKYL